MHLYTVREKLENDTHRILEVFLGIALDLIILLGEESLHPLHEVRWLPRQKVVAHLTDQQVAGTFS